MSRIGKRILTIPVGTEVSLQDNNTLIVKGKKGSLTKTLPEQIKIIIEEKAVRTELPEDVKIVKHLKQLFGTTNSLINQMLIGTEKGYSKTLEINGTGYRAALSGSNLTLNLGYSNPVLYKIPEGIKIEVPKPVIVIVSGIDKQLVGQVAANIREYRKPEPYKGKGIKYQDEKIRRKEGKASGGKGK